jgi:hypothetical protein
MEGGDLSQWLDGGDELNSGTGRVDVRSGEAHSGVFAASLTISNADGRSGEHGARLSRWRLRDGSPLPRSAYYSVWYRFPRGVRPRVFWNVMQWKTRLPSGESDPDVVLDVGHRRGSSRLFLYLFDHHAGELAGSSPVDLPVGRWVHVEVGYTWSTQATGRVSVFQDGRRVIDARGLVTQYPSTELEARRWSVNNYTGAISPPRVSLLVDDAAISPVRRGARIPGG